MEQNKEHWERIYQTKQSNELSWVQEYPKTSLEFIRQLNLSKTANIIDVGGGDSRLVDYLLNEGFENIAVLDISEGALEKAKHRLGSKAKKVNWIVNDITEFQPCISYDLWHDRATFHFLTSEVQIEKYLFVAGNALKENGYMIVATFSTDGPKKCSGLDIKQYNEETLPALMKNSFKKINCMRGDHVTPFGMKQNFLFCSFRRRTSNTKYLKTFAVK